MVGRPTLPNALKHGAYCKSVLLPGESATNFEKLRRDVVAELKPDGPLERDIVQTIARLVWRKQNMSTYQKAEMASKQISAIHGKYLPSPLLMAFGKSEEISAEKRVAYDHELKAARKELGEACELVDVGKIATSSYLLDQLDIEDRLDGVIDKCLKQLLMVRGVKSMKIQPS